MNKKILIIDDDKYLRQLYVEVLTNEGFSVSAAVDGEEGLNKVKAEIFDLILLDIMMPKIDGLDFLRKIKDLPNVASQGKVVILTNLAHDPIIKEGLALGAKSYLIKTDLDPDQLIEKVKSFVNI